MEAGILAVGSELLGPDRLDTNSLKLTESLRRFGVTLKHKAVVADREDEIAAELRSLVGRLDLVLVTGGLGPTADDVTREATARALGRDLRLSREVLADIRGKFERLGLQMPEVNRRQAMVIDGAELLINRGGTAPGLRVAAERATLFLLPGVPGELDGMIRAHLEPWLEARTGGRAVETATLKVACLPESVVEERILPAYEEFGREAISVLARPGEIQVRVTVVGVPEERRKRLERISSRLGSLLGEAVFSRRDEETLEAVVGEALRARSLTLVTAESCTGGLVAERITRVAGSSDYFLGSVVTYSNRLKIEVLGVPEELIGAQGAVSEAVARAMASGVRRLFDSDFSVAVTGIAGPGGGSEAKPVGTVHLAVAGPNGRTAHQKVRFPGDRQTVRWMSSQWALDLLRRQVGD